MAYDRYGSDEALGLRDLPDPKVGPGEVRIRVRCAGVNPVGWKAMSGGLDALMDAVFPVVPGWDVAGVIEAVGIDAPEFSIGDDVVAYARKDVLHGGTFAELVTMSVRGVAPKPASLGWEEAGGLPLAGLAALQTLDRLAVDADDTVLIHGGAGPPSPGCGSGPRRRSGAAPVPPPARRRR
jgi:NADPH:quinone reductase-like Zn-dependent oxidoreductase